MFSRKLLRAKYIIILALLLLLSPAINAKEFDLIQLNESLNVNTQDNKLTMADAIKLTLLNNPAVKIERSLIEEKTWSVKEQKSYLYPNVYFNENFLSSDNPVQAFMMQLNQRALQFPFYNVNYPGTKNNFSTRLGISLTVFDRNIYRKISISKLELKIQQEHGKKAVDDLVYSVRKAYVDVQMAKDRVSNATTLLQLSKDQMKAVENRKEIGTATKNEQLAAKAKMASFEESLARAQNDLNLSWIVLADVTGDESIVGYDLVDTIEEDYPVEDIDKLVKYSYLHRHEIRTVEAEKDKSLANLKLAKATSSVTVNAQGEWGVDTILANDNIARSFTAGVFIHKPLWDGGLRRSKIKQANAQIAKRDAEIDQAYRKIKLEVVQNYLTLKNTKERLNTISNMVNDAQESLRAYKERYAVGLATNVEVEAAQTKLSDSLFLKTSAMYDQKLSVINLQRAIGMPIRDILSNKGLLLKLKNPANLTELDYDDDVNPEPGTSNYLKIDPNNYDFMDKIPGANENNSEKIYNISPDGNINEMNDTPAKDEKINVDINTETPLQKNIEPDKNIQSYTREEQLNLLSKAIVKG